MPVYSYKTKKSGRLYLFKCSIHGQQFLCRSFKTREEAVSAEAAFLVGHGGQTRKTTFRKALDGYAGVLSTRVKLSSVYSFHLRCRKYLSGIPDVELSRLTFPVLYGWFSGLSCSAGVKERLLTDLKGFFDFCEVYYGYRNVDYRRLFVPKDYSIPSAPKPKFILSVDQFRTFYSVIDSPFWSFFFLFEFVCGLRVSEIVGLQVSCFDSSKKSVFIRQQSCQHIGAGRSVITSPKSADSVRTILLPEFLWERYVAFIGANRLRPDDFVFFGLSRSVPVGINTVYRWLARYQKKAGLPGFRFHSFRKSEASLLNDQGLSGNVIKDYLGHDSFGTTKKYYLGDSGEKKEMIRDVLEDRLSKLF